ncbi:MAG: hypothetical protein IJL14_02390 [Selenomonadaceae bacterium]|nr:hypothetical protein [Selenomonadaceae bacterium]
MEIEYYTRRVGEPLTAEEKAEIAALKDRPIVYDEDCPPMSKEKHEEIRYLMRKYNTRYITKEMWMAGVSRTIQETRRRIIWR